MAPDALAAKQLASEIRAAIRDAGSSLSRIRSSLDEVDRILERLSNLDESSSTFELRATHEITRAAAMLETSIVRLATLRFAGDLASFAASPPEPAPLRSPDARPTPKPRRKKSRNG